MLPDVQETSLRFVSDGDSGQEHLDAWDERGEGAGMREYETQSRVAVEDAAEVEV